MEQRTKRDSALISLVSEFEANFENGNIEYLNEKSFFQLIRFYEDGREYEKALDVAKDSAATSVDQAVEKVEEVATEKATKAAKETVK